MQNAFKMRPDILLRSGNYFNFLTPELSKFDITDIAHGLSNVCRFGGQSKEFYSVAQHSVLASYLVPDCDKYDALMHDAAEAMIGDIPKPLKELLPDYQLIEKRVENAISSRFKVSNPLPLSVKRADLIMLATEQRDLMPHHDDEWALIREITPTESIIKPVLPIIAYKMFLDRFHELTTGNSYSL